MSNETTERIGQGFCGKILHVDLGQGSHDYETLDEAFYKKYLSGVGLGARVLWDRMKPGADPLGPDNVLGFITGLLTDTGSLFTGRFMVVGKSPLSNGWGDSNCGGYFSPLLKRCGVDGVFFYGQADKPVYVYLEEDKIEIRDASELWGLDAIETENKLKEIHGNRVQVACIGPAGEKMVRFAGISNDGGRYAGRSGLGAVMGSKKLKAVVAAGRTRVGVKDKSKISGLTKTFRKSLEKGKGMRKILGDRMFGIVGWLTRTGSVYTRQPGDLFRQILIKFGTAGLTAMSAETGDSPIKNWGGIGYTDFPLKRGHKIGAQALISYETKKYGCYSCPVRCGGIVTVSDGPYPIEEMHKPEYETMCAFGGMALNDNIHTIMKINDLCNRGGVDTISCGGVAAFAVECFENGLLTTKDTNGLELRWGDGEALVRLTEMIVNREGIGDILAEGVKRAAEKIGQGAEKFAIHAGGVELPMHDPKFDPGFAPVYQNDATPGRHTTSSYTYLELQVLEKRFSKARKIPPLITQKRKHTYEDSGQPVAMDIFFKMLMDGVGACLFGTSVGGPMPLTEWINAATGWDLTSDDYLVIGERIQLLRHAFNVREGLNPVRDFKLHDRAWGNPPFDKGPHKKITIDMDTMSKSFYEAMRWDINTGKPEIDHLRQMGLEDVSQVLHEKD
jgi:aldehyde:ferredoxin oxidoreductase